jgi:hypothetical protein
MRRAASSVDTPYFFAYGPTTIGSGFPRLDSPLPMPEFASQGGRGAA